MFDDIINKDTRAMSNGIALVPVLLTFKIIEH